MASRLAIFDIATQTTKTVLIDPEIVEAPNWFPDGSGLIVNKAGLIFRVLFADPKLESIDTGFAQRCNNDHGVSPDGSELAISDATQENASCIYRVPIAGGMPIRVTQNVPSYWHGWSPDGATMTYTAKRNGVFDIFVISKDGGSETRLTSNFDHTDGPEFSNEGRWIWFNGARNGSMDLWRMKNNGDDLERMTSGPSVDWFPHPNPLNQTVLYISYEEGTQGHPRDKSVALKLLNVESGADDCLYSMIGGQGSINTPCWAPDGSKFAFVETVEINSKQE